MPKLMLEIEVSDERANYVIGELRSSSECSLYVHQAFFDEDGDPGFKVIKVIKDGKTVVLSQPEKSLNEQLADAAIACRYGNDID